MKIEKPHYNNNSGNDGGGNLERAREPIHPNGADSIAIILIARISCTREWKILFVSRLVVFEKCFECVSVCVFFLDHRRD